MTPTRSHAEQRRHKRLPMVNRDCRLTLLRRDGSVGEREICTLVDLSYAGLRLRGHQLLPVGESVEFLIHLESPFHRTGFARARIRWVRPMGFQEFEAGAEFSANCQGLFLEPD